MVEDNLQIAVSQGERGITILSLNGPLNIHTVYKFQDAVRSDVSPVLIIDCSGVPYIDSAGLGGMVGALVSARRVNRKIAFAALNKQAKVLVDMTHVSHILHTYDTVKEAEAAVY
ncbi:MAG TPA: STAS domain-containing protein [Candidatus Acidoferrales bacterium]|nr:STAS domain-containing protein [Candidatus Acidoferrales bacterium]